MKKTKFGWRSTAMDLMECPKVEYMIFQGEGEEHRHATVQETFHVLEGYGKAYVMGVELRLMPGTQIVIPMNTEHFMIPDEGQSLKAIVWYQDVPK